MTNYTTGTGIVIQDFGKEEYKSLDTCRLHEEGASVHDIVSAREFNAPRISYCPRLNVNFIQEFIYPRVRTYTRTRTHTERIYKYIDTERLLIISFLQLI